MLGIRRTSFHMYETSKYFNIWDGMHQVAYPVHLRKQVGGMKDANFIVFFLFFCMLLWRSVRDNTKENFNQNLNYIWL